MPAIACAAQTLRRLALCYIVVAMLAACAEAPPPPPALPTLVQPTPTAMVQVEVLGAGPTPTPAPSGFAIPQELRPGEHVSASGSFTETETEAAGPMLCQIQRNSCAFEHLIIDRDPNVVFGEAQPPPYGEENRMMHPAMQLPLARLAALVRNEWTGSVQLLVTAAYDSQFHHDLAEPNPQFSYSLHYEGRSIDLVPLPANPGRIARLCALALHAGFDWVHNEINHCHASIRAKSLCTVCSALAP